jgi:hypothetical protein
MKSYPWKQFAHGLCAPLRSSWTLGRRNSMRDTRLSHPECHCAGCVEDARRHAALWRLVERRRTP